MSYDDSIQLTGNSNVDCEKDIAIVGMSCKLPGAENYREYWELLQCGINAVSEIPEDRWKWREYFGNPAKDKNKTNSKWGGFIDGVDEFDPLFFNISPTEARYIDPQHRLFLQEAYHAVEDAGYDIWQLAGSKVGVYAGVSKNDYAELMRKENAEIESFVSTGTVHSILSNRVSYLFDLRGKSEVIDTACSSFLVALNNAVRDIRSGTCEAAIVGGVNLILSPTMYVSHGKSGMLSSKGVCKAFDKDADGYVRGEGVGVIFVKKLSHALQSNDHIWGVIKGISVSHGGRGNFLTAPRASSQSETLRDALRDGDITPDTVSYLEAHGTGTPLGDPVEFEGIKQAYGVDVNSPKSLCYLSSVKTNIGHLESAASVAGIIKILLSMKHGVIPKLLHYREANPLLHMDATRFRIAEKNVSWGQIHGERSYNLRAGLSSFGMGGVNAHVIVEKFSQKISEPGNLVNENGGTFHLVPITAGSKGQLSILAKKLGQVLSVPWCDIRLSDIAYTLQNGRRFEKHRKCFVVHSLHELLQNVNQFAENAQPDKSAGLTSAGDFSEVIERVKAWESGQIEFADISNDIADSGYRIPLPGYPFARRRCWYPRGITAGLNVSDICGANYSDNEENMNIAGVNDQISIPNKQRFLCDHVVQGTAILPGVAYLALVLNEYSSDKPGCGLDISDINWMRPCSYKHYSGTNFICDRKTSSNGEYIEFKAADKVIASFTAKNLVSTEMLLQQNINEYPLGSKSVSSVEQIYTELSDSGLDYGSAFKVIQHAYWYDNELTASLTCSTEGCDTIQTTVTILDGVFQAVVLLHNRLHDSKMAEQQVPFMCNRFVWCGKAIPNRCIARVSRVSSKRDIEEYGMGLFTLRGEQICRFDGFIKRPYKPSNANSRDHTTNTLNSHIYTTNWLECSIGTRAQTTTQILVYSEEPVARPEYLIQHRDRVVFYQEDAAANCHIGLQADPSDISSLNSSRFHELLQRTDLSGSLVYLARQSEQFPQDSQYRLLNLVQQILRNKHKQGSDILYVHDLSEWAVCQASMIAGFARTLKYENPNIRIRTLGLDEESMLNWEVHVLAELESYDNSTLGEIRYIQGIRQIHVVQNYIQSADSHSASQLALGNTIIKQGGHYLICGGAGGIGLQFAEYLVSEFDASVHIVGRRKQDDKIKESMQALQSLGGSATYWQTDISDKERARDLFDQIATQGIQLNGILQCAGLIEDSYIFNKSINSFSRVIAPKVSGTLNLDIASRDHKLDFIVLFSSVAALMPNQGQCDYAAANSFLDCFAYFRNLKTARGERYGRCVSINWPLWAKAGITVSASQKRHLKEVFGMEPMMWTAARKVFDFALSSESRSSLNNFIAIEGNTEKIRHSLKVVSGMRTERSSTHVERSLATTGDHQVSVHQLVELMLSELNSKPGPIDDDVNLSTAGFDSQALTMLADKINATFGTDLNPVTFFELNTIGQIQSFVDSVAKPPQVESNRQVPVDLNRTIHSGLLDILLCEPQKRIYRKRLSDREFFMRDHVVQGSFNVPGACFVEIAAQAYAQDYSFKPNVNRMVLKNNFWAKQLSTLGAEIEVVVRLSEGREPGTTSYHISCDGESPAVVYALGEMQVIDGLGAFEQSEMLDIESLVSRLPLKREHVEIYQYIVAEGLLVGDTLRPMSYAHISQEEVFAECRLPESIRNTLPDYLLHPTLLTGVLQAALLNNKPNEIEDTSYIPMGVDEVVIGRPLSSTCYITTQRRQLANDSMIRKYDAQVYNDKRELIAVMSGITLKSLTSYKQPEVEMITANPVDKEVSECDLESVQRMLIDIVATAVGLSAAEIDIEEQLDKYGLNSILVIDINQKLEELFGSLSKTLLYEYQTVGELANYFVENHFQLLVEKEVITHVLQQGEHYDSSADHGNTETVGRVLGKNANVANANSAVRTQNADLKDTAEKLVMTTANEIEEERTVTQPPPPDARQRRSVGTRVDQHGDRKPVVANTGENDIAIVGMAGRYPGANSIDELWDNLLHGVDNITSTPVDRFDPEALKLQDGAIDLKGCERGGFLDDVEKFDAALFNISPREAEKLDPQERLFLETAWSTIESAGYDYTKLKGMNIGVYVGALWQPYVSLGIEETQKGNLQTPTGLLYNIPNRVSYFFDWCGPSMVIDTACSSSLSALHLACNSIRTGEVSAALAGGVNLSFSASKYLWLARNKFLSSDGQCRSFGEGGDGYVPGEGVGAVFLKRLSQAVADGDNIYGVIKATTANHGCCENRCAIDLLY
ncbi:MAG: SDR family NAD(P)-dependent oxidoreductase [Candidatus Thiodiazotropha sp.]